MNLERPDYEMPSSGISIDQPAELCLFSTFMRMMGKQENLAGCGNEVLRVAWARDFISCVSGSIFEKP